MRKHKYVINEGDIFPTKLSGNLTVVKVLSSTNIMAVFEDGFIITTTSSGLRGGSVKNPYTPTFSGVGFLGVGPYKTVVTETGKNTPEYVAWYAMIARCYRKVSRAAYVNCTVWEPWHNFQNFAKWYTENKNYGRGFALDKDLTKSGNSLYCPDFCALIPQEINNLVLKRKSDRGPQPIGVYFRAKTGSYTASISRKGRGSQHIGVFPTQEAAFLAYKFEKESYIKSMAEEYKNDLTNAVYENLLSYIVTITD